MLYARRICGALLVAALYATPLLPLAATSIAYQAIDLTDTTPGEDRWRYSYIVSGSFPQFFGFEIKVQDIGRKR